MSEPLTMTGESFTATGALIIGIGLVKSIKSSLFCSLVRSIHSECAIIEV